MSSKQPEALRLSDWLETDTPTCLTTMGDAAAELRRLHAANADLLKALQGMVDRFHNHSTDQEDPPKTYGCDHAAETCVRCEGLVTGWKAVQAARAAIAKAIGEQA